MNPTIERELEQGYRDELEPPVTRPTATICPSCGSNQLRGDFEPDIGHWNHCENCGHEFKLSTAVQESKQPAHTYTGNCGLVPGCIHRTRRASDECTDCPPCLACTPEAEQLGVERGNLQIRIRPEISFMWLTPSKNDVHQMMRSEGENQIRLSIEREVDELEQRIQHRFDSALHQNVDEALVADAARELEMASVQAARPAQSFIEQLAAKQVQAVGMSSDEFWEAYTEQPAESAKPRAGKPYSEHLRDYLRSREEIAGYLAAALEEDDAKLIKLMIGDAVDALRQPEGEQAAPVAEEAESLNLCRCGHRLRAHDNECINCDCQGYVAEGEAEKAALCPFCKSPNIGPRTRQVGWGHNPGLEERRVIVCDDCGAQGPAFGIMSFNNDGAALQYWNHRASIDPASLSAERCAEVLREIRHNGWDDWQPSPNGSCLEAGGQEEPWRWLDIATARIVSARAIEHGALVREGEVK